MTSHDRLFENQTPNSGYTLRKMYEFYQSPYYKRISRVPLYKAHLNPEQIKLNKRIMDSMTDEELDRPNPEQMSVVQMQEIGRRSGHGVREVSEILKELKRLKTVWGYVERKMSDTMAMDMYAMFWSEISTHGLPSPNQEVARGKLMLRNWVESFLLVGFLFLVPTIISYIK